MTEEITQGTPDPADGWWSDEAATFGDRLAAAREAAGMSQEKLATRLGVKHSTLARWEDDLAEPRANRLQMLAGILSVSLSWLLTGAGEGPEAPTGGPMSDGVKEALAEMRQIRAEVQEAATRMGQLEKRLRRSLIDAA